ncbi:MAG: GNAT family N-acetyltransferase [Planctomycetota bacterium]
MNVLLREMIAGDLPAVFEHQQDPVGRHMAAFTSKDPTDRAAFMAHWSRLLVDASVTKRTILLDGRLVGSIASFGASLGREVTYWIAKEHWGKGVATAALGEILKVERTRPLFARAAKDNLGSIRVLEKCGFRICREGRWFANARGAEIEEVVLELR